MSGYLHVEIERQDGARGAMVSAYRGGHIAAGWCEDTPQAIEELRQRLIARLDDLEALTPVWIAPETRRAHPEQA